jgi:hypothetical protein
LTGNRLIERPLPTQVNTNTKVPRNTFMPRVGFEPMIPVLERYKTIHSLGHCERHLQNLDEYVGFEALKAVAMKSSIFWDMTPCSPVKINLRFGGTC